MNNPRRSHHRYRIPMKKTSILIIFIVSITIFPPASGNQPNNEARHGPQENCSYLIQIKTTCVPSAETSDPVSVRFYDSLGHSIIVKRLKNPKLVNAPKDGIKNQGGAYTGFQRCATDTFEASGPCMTQRVCSLYLKKVGPDPWRPAWAKVLRRRNGGDEEQISALFRFGNFLPENVWHGPNCCHSKEGSVPPVECFVGKN